MIYIYTRMNRKTYIGCLWDTITKCLSGDPRVSLISIDGVEFVYDFLGRLLPSYSINTRIGRFVVNGVPLPDEFHRNLDDIDMTRRWLYETLFIYCNVLLTEGVLCHPSENIEALSTIFDSLQPSFGSVMDTLRTLGLEEETIELSRYENDRLHLLVDMTIANTVLPCDQRSTMIEKIRPVVMADLGLLWDNEQRYFRLVDAMGDSLMYQKENIRHLLLCGDRYYDPYPMFFVMRVNHYLRHNEPHFRNILFRFHREEIMLRLVLFQDVFDSDIAREIMMIYLWYIISP